MISKNIMLKNIDIEIEKLNNCIKDLEYQKQFIVDVDDEIEMVIKNDDVVDGKFLCSIVEKSKIDCYYSKPSYLFSKSFKKL